MTIDQRNAGAAVTPSDGAYTLDRWVTFRSGGGAYTVQQSSTVPSGVFSKSIALTVTTPDASIAASEYYALNQYVEGFNAADFGWGTAAATSASLSFYIRSSVTGTWVVALCNADGSRAYPATFTISAADTWQYVTLNIPAITTGTWNTTNGSGITLRFDLGSGSNNNGTANTWNTTGSFAGTRTSGSVNWISTSGATLFITGVQLELGSTATPFEFRSIGTELGLCQRYYQNVKAGVGVAANTSAINWTAPLLVQMRATPSIGKTATSFSFGDMVSFSYTSSGTPSISAEANNLSLTGLLDGFTTLTAYRFYRHEPSGGDNALFALSAEL
jgi:hypothetical protein